MCSSKWYNTQFIVYKSFWRYIDFPFGNNGYTLWQDFLAGELPHLPIMLSTIGTFIHAEKNMGDGGEIGRKAVIKKKIFALASSRVFSLRRAAVN